MTDPVARALAHVRGLGAAGAPAVPARITVSFHPDRRLRDGRTVAEHLATEGVYRSQFETGISNGGLTARPGGDRERWEHRMFAGAYPSSVTAGRPVYGGLNLAGHPDGASPRFGSCHLVLRPEVAARATFSHGDSVTEPTIVGTSDTFGGIHAALLEQVARTGSALGVAAGSAEEWVAALGESRTAAGRTLDDYVEAQIHGGVDLTTDVEAVVADPSFSGTPTAAHLARLAPLSFHPGFELAPAEFPDHLRGPEAPQLARSLGVDVIDAAVLGRADTDPQLIKYLWHILVLLGRPHTLQE
ncbi:DUF3626 domain-containing protein [Actinoplanes friuliensis]|uniref:DUF3626 domain-containing protein n=1 Tax=Actinoplanes friuliensis DSM 7358 TaxID=1246995 RepID=U5W3H6_9ACTN|nr:DUF3626 domain-containing protein [Actinoplanes friuliensis]AGZ42535.1 hypothetical protein AFR_21315 [Actinoplanes friuliensis DSM 7358]